MKGNGWKGILTLAVITLLAFGVILAADYFGTAGGKENTEQSAQGKREEINLTSVENVDSAIQSAYRLLDGNGNAGGYAAVSKAKGYDSDIVVEVSFDKNCETITGISILEQHETQGLGARIAEEEFLGQFNGAVLPVKLGGNAEGSKLDGISGATISSKAVIKAVNRAYEFLRSYLGTLS